MAIKVDYRIYEPVEKTVDLKELINLKSDSVKKLQFENEEIFFDLKNGKFKFDLSYRSDHFIKLHIYDGKKIPNKPHKQLIEMMIYEDTDLEWVEKIIEAVLGEEI